MLKQLSIYAENKKGTVQHITGILAKQGINILGSVINDGTEYGVIRMIVSDEADETQLGVTSADEVQTDNGKCTSLLFMRKTTDGMEFCRSTETVI